jgi:hypothetical protein
MRRLRRSGSLMTVARELASYRLHSLGVQEVTWDKESTVRAEGYTSFIKGKRKSSVWGRILCISENRISS